MTPTPKLPSSEEKVVSFDAQRNRIEALRGKRSNPADSPRKVLVQAPGTSTTFVPFSRATQKKLLATKRTDGFKFALATLQSAGIATATGKLSKRFKG